MYPQSILMAWASSKFTVLNQKPTRQMCLPPMEMKMVLEVLYFVERNPENKIIGKGGSFIGLVFLRMKNKQTPLNKFIKVLSYNIYFWDLELHERMKVIGDFIQLRSPAGLCLQEVTQEKYQIFQQSTLWWKAYRCLIAYNFVNVKPYLCMQVIFDIGEELCLTEIEVGGEGSKQLVIATSHLESSCPAPPKDGHVHHRPTYTGVKLVNAHTQA
ncbi:hypothetical protein MKX01_034820 [Papaver californicum]|nr:hypothetical protein MKX01_034820 [Papaver californicum]